jgi:type I restriction enzyme, R subunit
VLEDLMRLFNSEQIKQASRTLLASLQELIKPMPTWTKNTQTQAEVKVLVLDTLWEKLPRPPFSEEDTEALAERVYDFVWQQSAGGRFMENMRAV